MVLILIVMWLQSERTGQDLPWSGVVGLLFMTLFLSKFKATYCFTSLFSASVMLLCTSAPAMLMNTVNYLTRVASEYRVIK